MGLQGVVSGRVTTAARASNRPELTMNPAGQISGMVRRIRPAREVLEDMVEGAARVLAELASSRVTVSV
jgi:NAD(P)H-dependent flavin oxidoreductase YrpB (nitropropane dioxygenase family)